MSLRNHDADSLEHPRHSSLSSRQVFSLIIKFRSFIVDLA